MGRQTKRRELFRARDADADSRASERARRATAACRGTSANSLITAVRFAPKQFPLIGTIIDGPFRVPVRVPSRSPLSAHGLLFCSQCAGYPKQQASLRTDGAARAPLDGGIFEAPNALPGRRLAAAGRVQARGHGPGEVRAFFTRPPLVFAHLPRPKASSLSNARHLTPIPTSKRQPHTQNRHKKQHPGLHRAAVARRRPARRRARRRR